MPLTITNPDLNPPLCWWPELMTHCSPKLCLGRHGDKNVILSPSRSGYRPSPCTVTMWACRVSCFSIVSAYEDSSISFFFFFATFCSLFPRSQSYAPHLCVTQMMKISDLANNDAMGGNLLRSIHSRRNSKLIKATLHSIFISCGCNDPFLVMLKRKRYWNASLVTFSQT